ncbi:50S ribosomal protein L33 [Cohnella thailandensis]|jgi:hypothetical protein|uniref:50S ribosomal protein L33 n=1 Tax=Cohnella thailandensis TaxID=557557 RepID=A0A841SNX1_9BACL|nr:50S ribosomal protein L33 [Cohnella thailandensis]MBB6633644.1 50S ribosomal protein L33 [Cohnella thailandensis]MBP1976429.1 hypothetical protein [Cohnella thailandensis]
MSQVTREQAAKLVGKTIYAKRKDGSVVSGKLVRLSGNELILEVPTGKKARTKAIIPLVLFDLLAIGTTPFGFGGFGGWGGYNGFYGGGWW